MKTASFNLSSSRTDLNISVRHTPEVFPQGTFRSQRPSLILARDLILLANSGVRSNSVKLEQGLRVRGWGCGACQGFDEIGNIWSSQGYFERGLLLEGSECRRI